MHLGVGWITFGVTSGRVGEGLGLAVERATGSPGEKAPALDQAHLAPIFEMLMKGTGPFPGKMRILIYL